MQGSPTAVRPRIRPWMWVAGTVLAGWALVAAGTLQMSGWLVQTDELQNVRLAMDAADRLSPVPSVHGERFAGVSQLYALVIAPAFRLFPVPAAFDVIHLLNALLLASAAIPTYLMCRRVVASQAVALAVGFLAVVTPWAALTLPVWGEPLAYPVFLWSVYALFVAIAEPSPRQDLLALAALTVAFFTRTQFLTLWLAFPVAVLAHHVGFAVATHPGGERLRAARLAIADAARAHLPLVACLIAGALVLLVVGITPFLGPYAGTVGESSVLPGGTFPLLLKHVALLGTGLAVVPVVAGVGWILSTVWSPVGRVQHAFMAVAVVAGGGLMLQATTFVVRFGGGEPTDRYFFYVVPLLLIASAALLVDGPRRPVALVGAALLFGWALTKTSFEAPVNPAVSPGSTINVPLTGRVGQVRDVLSLDFLTTPSLVRVLIVLATVVVVAALLWSRSWIPRIAVVAAAAVFVMAGTAYSFHSNLAARTDTKTADWVDQLDLGDAPIGMLPSRLTPEFDASNVQSNLNQWWALEFRNKSIDRPYSFNGSPQYTALPGQVLTADPRTGALSAPTTPRYVVLDRSRVDLGPVGREVGGRGPLRALDLGARPRTRWAIEGLSAGATGLGAGRTARIRAFPPPGDAPARLQVSVALANPPGAPRWSQSYRLTADGKVIRGRLRGAKPVVVRFGGCVKGRPLTAKLRAGALGLPFEGDTIGLVVQRVRVSARPGGCGARPGTG